MKNPESFGRDFISEEDYSKMEETSPIKHEYWDGEIFAMSGGTFQHGLVAANIGRHIGNRLDGKPCVAVGSDMRVKIAKSKKRSHFYPDISVVCPPFEFEEKRSGVEDTLLNPCVIFEVLSPSTMEFDQNDKFDEYKLLDSLTDYVLVWPERVRVKHYHRNEKNEWVEKSYSERDDKISLSSLGIVLSLQEIYADVEMTQAPVLRLKIDEDNDE